MIKRLRIKLVLVLSGLLVLVLVGILCAVNIFNYHSNMDNSYKRIERLNSSILMQRNKNTFFFNGNSKDYYYLDKNFGDTSEYYFAFVNPDRVITQIATEENSRYSYDEIAEFTKTALSHSAKNGTIKNLIYNVTLIDYGEFGKGFVVGFMDNSVTVDNINHFVLISITIFIIGTAIIIVLSLLISFWLIKPVELAFNKQKQFISDASHELKTPIAVISANADILESEIGNDNKWLGYIRSESERMSKLITSLLTLTRIELQEDKTQLTHFDMCNAVMEITMPFESVAFEKGIFLQCEPEGEVFVNGNEQQLKQVVAILTDNAIKHCTENGIVSVNVYPTGKNRCTVSVSNDGEPIPYEIRDKIFERFFRADESRTREENRYGLGLAIAKQIIENHKGTISIKCDDNITTFVFTI